MTATTPSRKELTHERILETAARAIRRVGYGGIGVADLMKQAGLTHGGFYAHFSSRDAMLAEAMEWAGRDSERRLSSRLAKAEQHGSDPFVALVEGYLSLAHLAGPEAGCPVAALASEMPRQSAEVLEAGRSRVQALMTRVQQVLPSADADEARVIVSSLVGALQLARALGDNEQGHALLAANRQALLARHGKKGRSALSP
ncbi:TetR/AcrR family transcriptional regulator [Paucibacter sp. PLA-PC-4]|uniref:TetR/AcrR family transcriptional regulator n=1 Tax=Paucibacter sp. PLA-PC-4 TaxID=2993655 RepID=UPI0022490506|nr:TetR/AcrR family transcriptional regulator [Paucibacter sp. PLA-PC-4]MCX2863066.1 TetR/AcrR family transcriptional regulator [Paucibacter sp. PLA-PC-4]